MVKFLKGTLCKLNKEKLLNELKNIDRYVLENNNIAIIESTKKLFDLLLNVYSSCNIPEAYHLRNMIYKYTFKPMKKVEWLDIKRRIFECLEK